MSGFGKSVRLHDKYTLQLKPIMNTATFKRLHHHLILLTCCILATAGHAQVVIDAADFPATGSERYRAVDTLPQPGLDILPAGGANLSWDFTQDVAVDRLDTIRYLDPQTVSLPFDFVYPTANYAVQVLPENTSIFVENTAAGHRWLGVSNPAFPVPFTPQRDFLQFSMEYGDQDTSWFGNDLMFPFDVTMTSFDSSRVKNETAEYFDYDAWGTFVDHEGNNVPTLRRKHMTISKDSIWGWTGGNMVFVTEAIDTTQGYSWFGAATGVLANADVDASGDVIHAEFFRNSPLTVATQPLSPALRLEVWPNPSESTFTFSGPAVLRGTLSIFTTEGRPIRQKHFNGQPVSLDLSGQAAGVYFYHFQNSTTSQHGKLILQH